MNQHLLPGQQMGASLPPTNYVAQQHFQNHPQQHPQQLAHYRAATAAAAASAYGRMNQYQNLINTTVPNENDVLCGRGVNIAHHSGNERFRTLVICRRDRVGAIDGSFSMDATTASEKRHLAEEIIRHIANLDPPGRFLKREIYTGRRRGGGSRGKNGTGLDVSGTWMILSDREAMKKTCQALRDCSRVDRAGYAIGVQAPQDVIIANEQDKAAGINVVSLSETGVVNAPPPTPRVPPIPNASGIKRESHLPPDVEYASSLLKKQKYPPPLPPTAPQAAMSQPPQPSSLPAAGDSACQAQQSLSMPNANSWVPSSNGQQVSQQVAPVLNQVPPFNQLTPAPATNGNNNVGAGVVAAPAPMSDPYKKQEPQAVNSFLPVPVKEESPSVPVKSEPVSALGNSSTGLQETSGVSAVAVQPSLASSLPSTEGTPSLAPPTEGTSSLAPSLEINNDWTAQPAPAAPELEGQLNPASAVTEGAGTDPPEVDISPGPLNITEC